MQKFLRELTPEELEEVKKMASIFLTPREIAIVLEKDVDTFIYFCDQHHTPVYQAFHAGRLLSEIELRTSIIKLAKSGSSPAQTMALDMLNKSKMKMLDR